MVEPLHSIPRISGPEVIPSSSLRDELAVNGDASSLVSVTHSPDTVETLGKRRRPEPPSAFGGTPHCCQESVVFSPGEYGLHRPLPRI